MRLSFPSFWPLGEKEGPDLLFVTPLSLSLSRSLKKMESNGRAAFTQGGTARGAYIPYPPSSNPTIPTPVTDQHHPSDQHRTRTPPTTARTDPRRTCPPCSQSRVFSITCKTGEISDLDAETKPNRRALLGRGPGV